MLFRSLTVWSVWITISVVRGIRQMSQPIQSIYAYLDRGRVECWRSIHITMTTNTISQVRLKRVMEGIISGLFYGWSH